MMQKHTLTNHNHNKHRQRCRDGSLSRHLNSSHNHWHTTISRAIPALSLFSLTVLTILALSPNVTRSVYADEPVLLSNDTPAVSLTLTSGVSASGNTNLAQKNITAGTIAYQPIGFNVTATGTENYSIFVQAGNGSNGNLKGQTNTTIEISGVDDNTAGNSIPTNRWGYALTEGSISNDGDLAKLRYNKVPDSGATVASSLGGTTATDKPYTLAFAANIGNNNPADHYQSNVLLSIAANAKDVTAITDFASYTTMQEITKAKCDSIPTGTEGRLRDTRDDKWYWVAKQKDGLCWMTQNLDYDGGGSGFTSVTGNFSSDDTTGKYYNPGEKYVCNDTPATNCADNLGTIDFTTEVSWTPTNDPNFIASSSYTGTDGTTLCTKTAGLPYGKFSDTKTTVCRIYYAKYQSSAILDHYLVGNYYNWYAATNGTGTSATTTNEEASGSICPDGWSLPTGAYGGSFSNLISAGGITSNSTGSLALRNPPYYYVRSGDVSNGYLASASSNGLCWSATAYDLSYNGQQYKNAYSLFLNASEVSPNYTSRARSSALPVRCVAR